MQVEVATKVKDSTNQTLAGEYMRFILSDEFQDLISTRDWMYPVTNIKLFDNFNILSMQVNSWLGTPKIWQIRVAIRS